MDKDSTQSIQQIAEARPRRSKSAQVPENPETEIVTPGNEAPAQNPKMSSEEVEKLVTDNVKLAYWFASQWRNIPGAHSEDIEAQAIHGLVKAANTFDPAKGNFAGYASQVIRNYLGHMHHHQGEKTTNEPASLDAPIGSGDDGGDDSSMHDKFGDPTDKGAGVSTSQSEASKIINDEIDLIPEPDRSMVRRHWMNGESYRDLQKDFRLSFMQISNRVNAAMANVKARLAARGILGLQDIWPESMVDGTAGKFIYECLLAQVEISLALNSLQDSNTVTEVRRFTTRGQDMAFLLKSMSNANREWKVGDEARVYRGDGIAKISKIEGDIIYLDNGESMHKSHMKLPDDKRYGEK